MSEIRKEVKIKMEMDKGNNKRGEHGKVVAVAVVVVVIVMMGSRRNSNSNDQRITNNTHYRVPLINER